VAVEAWRASGASYRDFARRHGFDPQRLGWWATRLRASPQGASSRLARDAERPAVRFHPVQVIACEDDARVVRDATARVIGTNECTERIEIIDRDGRVVRVPAGCAVEAVARVLLALRLTREA
jgi:hypothetical protein